MESWSEDKTNRFFFFFLDFFFSRRGDEEESSELTAKGTMNHQLEPFYAASVISALINFIFSPVPVLVLLLLLTTAFLWRGIWLVRIFHQPVTAKATNQKSGGHTTLVTVTVGCDGLIPTLRPTAMFTWWMIWDSQRKKQVYNLVESGWILNFPTSVDVTPPPVEADTATNLSSFL